MDNEQKLAPAWLPFVFDSNILGSLPVLQAPLSELQAAYMESKTPPPQMFYFDRSVNQPFGAWVPFGQSYVTSYTAPDLVFDQHDLKTADFAYESMYDKEFEYTDFDGALVFDGDFWIGSELYSMPFSEMQNAKIGVEATHYLQHMIDEPPSHEPLLAALGGSPIGLRHHIEVELDRWAENNMTPLFVFEGQSTVGKEEMALKNAKHSLIKTESSWELYAMNHPEEAVKTFGASGAVRPTELYRILQDVLIERKLDFIVAPFSACAQLAYLDTLDAQYIDGIMGSQELLLYSIHDAVICTPSVADWEKKAFSGIIKSELIRKLNVTPETFADALLMAGTSFLSAFPPLLDEGIISRQPFTIADAVNLLRTSEKSVANTCAAFSDILQVRDPKWLDKYRKAKMGVKHCVTVQEDGSVRIKDFESLTSDNHEYLGLQLPPELYHYLSKVVIGPRLMNTFSSSQSTVYPTLDGVVSSEYKTLVSESLIPVKEATAAVITSRIHRGFQFKDISVKFWYDDNLKQVLNHRNMSPHPNSLADTWAVKEADLTARESQVDVPPGKLSFSVLSLKDPSFSAKSVGNTKSFGLQSKPEILSNALWRLLHIRGYVNNKHELTTWGKALATTLQTLRPTIKSQSDVQHLEEGAFLAYELIRFDHLNHRNRHPELIGGALRGTEEDKAACILIGRSACLLKLRHSDIGYTGPLSKNFLHFYSIIKAVREADRDLLEAITASMFLANQANRNRTDFETLGFSLPLLTDINVGLGIAVKTYLDDYCKVDASPSQRRTDKQKYSATFLPHGVNFAEDLDVAFSFFDALYDGVKTLGSDEMASADRKVWDNAVDYLEKRR